MILVADEDDGVALLRVVDDLEMDFRHQRTGGVQMELRALIGLRAVLDELIRNRMHADSGCVEPLMFHGFQYGAAEAAADQMLLDRDEPGSHSERLFEQF